MSHEFEDRALEDKEFDEYLRRGTEVSQRYRELGGREVPPALDAKVLRHARQQAAKSSSRRRPWLRWGAPLAFAATALIAITVVMQPEVVTRSAMQAPSALQPRAEPRATEAPVAELPKVAGDSPADPASQNEVQAGLPESGRTAGEADSASSDAIRARLAAEAKSAAATQPAAPAGASGLASTRADSSAAQDRDLRDEQRRAATELERSFQQARRDSGAPAELARLSKELKVTAESDEIQKMMRARESVSQPASNQSAATREESKAKRKQETDDTKSDAAPPVPAAPAPVAAMAPPPPPPAKPVAELPRSPAAGPPPPEPAAEGVSTLEADRITAPATWVRWIRDLRAQGNQPRAEELLKRLRAAHPSFALPADLAPPPQQR